MFLIPSVSVAWNPQVTVMLLALEMGGHRLNIHNFHVFKFLFLSEHDLSNSEQFLLR